jgi:hypothetical protein
MSMKTSRKRKHGGSSQPLIDLLGPGRHVRKRQTSDGLFEASLWQECVPGQPKKGYVQVHACEADDPYVAEAILVKEAVER